MVALVLSDPNLTFNSKVTPRVSFVGCSWLIERRVAGTAQVSTVGYLPPDPAPLSFLDSSSALSPWTGYQYRLVLYNQAGNSTGETTDTACVGQVTHWASERQRQTLYFFTLRIF